MMNKKEELLINAAKIIYEEGIQKLTIDYLAQKSNITKGGVLYHFESKSKLILQMNKLAIERFEHLLTYYADKLSGQSIFTRAYAYATLDFFKRPEIELLPAVFISSLEDEESFKLWEKTSQAWEEKFKNDSGDKNANLILQLMCDGIWFSILFDAEKSLDKHLETLVLHYCQSLEEKRSF